MNGILDNFLKDKGYFSAEDDLLLIEKVQRMLAERFPFENLDVMTKVEENITPEYIEGKMIEQNRGGLCYELNALQHLILRKLGLDVHLASATVHDESGWVTDRTHVMNLFWKKDDLFVADSGFGTQLPMKPVQLDGPPVQSPGGTFRLRTLKTEKGTVAFQLKRQGQWITRYAFFPEEVEWDELNRIKKVIHEHPQSAFNKQLLIAQALKNGTVSLNEQRLLVKTNQGEEQRIHFSSYENMLEKIKDYFSRSIYDQALQYVHRKRNVSQ
ncbi:arylamine N-acetyltransferase [Siminovitchia sediminis]|uniref:Arylamine N-acetyltransferase n=1 Tax=Siminovitchia sediminis TaxID=1274353 RepID=A0ABW4KJL3_9BACI